MGIFCGYVGVLCIILGLIGCIDSIYGGLSLMTSGFILLVLGKHLTNQKAMIKAIRELAIPQLYYADHYAPTVLRKRIVEEYPEYKSANITLTPGFLTDEGTYQYQGVMEQWSGHRTIKTKFISEIACGQYYQMKAAWVVVRLEWM